MTKTDPPETENLFVTKEGKINADLVAKFSEALKSEAGKDFDAIKELKLTPPKPDTPKETKSDKGSPEEATRLKEMASFAIDALKKDHDIDLLATPQESKMSEFEKTMDAKYETIALAKFGEQLEKITKENADFDIDSLKELKIPTESKIQVAKAVQDIISKNAEAVQKVQGELDKITSELTEVKTKVPKEPEANTTDGKARVLDAAAKLGLDVASSDSKVDPRETLAKAIAEINANKGDK